MLKVPDILTTFRGDCYTRCYRSQLLIRIPTFLLSNPPPCTFEIVFFFLFMSDAHQGINSSTQKYLSTQSNVALTSCRQDSGSPPF